MQIASGLLGGFDMDSGTLAGPLELRLQAMAYAGFCQVSLSARDVVAQPGGAPAVAQALQALGLRPTALQALRDFEGLSGPMHRYKVEIAQSLLELCQALDCAVLVARATTLEQASGEPDVLARDLRKLAMLALPLGIRVAYVAHSASGLVPDFGRAWDLVCQADCPNLGLGLDLHAMVAAGSPLDELEDLDASRIFQVQLSDGIEPTAAQASGHAPGLQVFPGEGLHSAALADVLLRLDAMGYQGDYSLAVHNADYLQLPATSVAQRASRSALWLREDVLHRSAPLPWVASRG